MKIWGCKIGEVDEHRLASGSDLPMRQAVSRAYREITGRDSDFIFSGWGGELTEVEREVVEDDRARQNRTGVEQGIEQAGGEPDGARG